MKTDLPSACPSWCTSSVGSTGIDSDDECRLCSLSSLGMNSLALCGSIWKLEYHSEFCNSSWSLVFHTHFFLFFGTELDKTLSLSLAGFFLNFSFWLTLVWNTKGLLWFSLCNYNAQREWINFQVKELDDKIQDQIIEDSAKGTLQPLVISKFKELFGGYSQEIIDSWYRIHKYISNHSKVDEVRSKISTLTTINNYFQIIETHTTYFYGQREE